MQQIVGDTDNELLIEIDLRVDWCLFYITMDSKSQSISQASVMDLKQKGLVERVDDPIMWSTSCQTDIAQAYLDDLDKSSKFSDIKLK